MNLLLQIPPMPELEDAIGPDSPLLPPVHTIPWWTWVIAALVLAGIGRFLWRLLRKRKPEPVNHRAEALRRIRKLEQSADQESPYVFSIQVCDVLRRYCENRFGLRATSQTSPEFLANIREHPGFVREEKERLAEFLERCDAIKFARAAADIIDNHKLSEAAEFFVKGGPA